MEAKYFWEIFICKYMLLITLTMQKSNINNNKQFKKNKENSKKFSLRKFKSNTLRNKCTEMIFFFKQIKLNKSKTI